MGDWHSRHSKKTDGKNAGGLLILRTMVSGEQILTDFITARKQEYIEMGKTTTPVCSYCRKKWETFKGHDLTKIPELTRMEIQNHMKECSRNPLAAEIKQQAEQIAAQSKACLKYERIIDRMQHRAMTAETENKRLKRRWR
jgi:hypothetical protein